MKIILHIKDTSTLSRIDELDKALQEQKAYSFKDVVENISKEW